MTFFSKMTHLESKSDNKYRLLCSNVSIVISNIQFGPTLNDSNVFGDCCLKSKYNIKKPYTCTHVYTWYTFHRYKLLFELFMQLAITFACPMLYLNDVQNCSTHLFYICYAWILCVTFGFTINFWHFKVHFCCSSYHICTQIDYIWAVKPIELLNWSNKNDHCWKHSVI